MSANGIYPPTDDDEPTLPSHRRPRMVSNRLAGRTIHWPTAAVLMVSLIVLGVVALTGAPSVAVAAVGGLGLAATAIMERLLPPKAKE